MKKIIPLFLMLFIVFTPNAAADQVVRIAVAANFLATLKDLSKEFTEETGIQVYISNGASGMLYTKIKRGAPYDLFFSADARRPVLLEEEGLIEVGSRFTYVTGRLVAWSPEGSPISPDLTKLDPTDKSLRFFAIANPKTAPYGLAAIDVLKHYGLYDSLVEQQKIALGENIGKAYQYTATGNAQIGLVAKSYVSNPDRPVKGQMFEIPLNLYPLLEQQAVIVKGRKTAEVMAFLEFFRSDKAQERIQYFGYGVQK